MGVEKRLCIRMHRFSVEFLPAAFLDNIAEIHDNNPVGDMLDNRKVMGDEDHRQVSFLQQLGQQVEHLGLDGNVKGGNRFIGDDQVRFCRKGSGNADSLPLAAGEFMRIALGMVVIKTDLVEKLDDLGVHFLF